MQEILIISNYYPPEKGAAANRIEQLALKLKQHDYTVSVVCPLANYPFGKLFPHHKKRLFVNEKIHDIHIKRLWIYPSVSKNSFKRLLSTLSFSIGLLFYLIFTKTPQKVIIQSPPLLLSFISVVVLSLKNKKIILNVSDLWPLAAIELSAVKKDSFSHKVSLFMERFIYRKASLVLGQSNEIIEHVTLICPTKKCYLYRNFPDHNRVDSIVDTIENQPIKIFYAGLLGVAQGVLELCKNINLSNLNIELHIYGDGAEKTKIEDFISTSKNSKILFHGMKERNDLHLDLQKMDIAIVPLKTRIYGSVPSKIFEYSTLGFPILYFGGGEGSVIVAENKLGWVAKVGDFKDLNKTLIEISKLDKTALDLQKNNVFNASLKAFNLNIQIQDLIQKNVF
jgi:glycosyltransferase involved in cell wall biosynthesis